MLLFPGPVHLLGIWMITALPLSLSSPSCRKDEDCSFNGACTDGGCDCFTGWTGVYCHQLDLLPASNGSGFNLLHRPPNGKPTSTWGGSVIYKNETGMYHMFASEISQSCGIHRWTTNSFVVHAVSKGEKDDWRFEKVGDPVLPIFSHEPIVTEAPDGTLALFVTFYPNGSVADCPTCTCSDGTSASGGSSCNVECGCGVNKTMFSYFTTSKSPYGPWSPLQSLCATQVSGFGNGTCEQANHPRLSPQIDLNLAPVILPNGTLLAWTRWDIWRSDDWRDPIKYEDIGQAPDFNTDPPTPWEGEDPSMWIDSRGIYHILSHNGDRGAHYKTNASGDCGRHYYSRSGLAGTWRVAPLLPPEDLGGCAYPRINVPFANGKNYSFYRRERPHLIFGPPTKNNDSNEDGVSLRRIPIALSTSVIDSPSGPMFDDVLYNTGSSSSSSLPQRDASYTLVQPLRQT